ncbi:MAG: VOC family protein [Anaerolineae bacterium]|nr:VOC family protein [Anaerolineae bacterium]
MFANASTMTTLPAHNLQRALDFYHERLGLSPEQLKAGGAIFRCGSTSFFLYQTPSAGTARNTVMSFIVDDVEHAVATLRQNGVVFEDYDFPGLKTINGIADLDGERSAWFVDSEGNIIAVSQWT